MNEEALKLLEEMEQSTGLYDDESAHCVGCLALTGHFEKCPLAKLKTLLESDDWVAVADGLPEKISAEQHRKCIYPLVFAVNMNITNSVVTAYLNEHGYFCTVAGGQYDKTGEYAITHWKKITLPQSKEETE